MSICLSGSSGDVFYVNRPAYTDDDDDDDVRPSMSKMTMTNQ